MIATFGSNNPPRPDRERRLSEGIPPSPPFMKNVTHRVIFLYKGRRDENRREK